MPDDVRIVEARDDHATGLVALIESIFGEYPGVLFDIEEMPELLRIASTFAADGGVFWCAFSGDRLVGCVGWSPAEEPGGIELKKLYVAKDARQTGLGGKLTQMVEDAARARGCAFVDLWSDTRFETAHRFYERRGYERDGRTRELHDKSHSIEFYFRRPLGPSEGS